MWYRVSRIPPGRNRSYLYPAVGLVLALIAGSAAVMLRSVGGRGLYAALWLVIASLLVIGGWLFGRQEDRLRRISLTDPLTGLANRRELEHRMTVERARAARDRSPLSLVLVDVDRLKAINDRGGHRMGDRALVAVADALRGSCRATDVPARLGGDEFAVLAPATAARDATQLAARLQAILRLIGSIDGERVSVSIGVADLDSAVGHDLFDAADLALYRAKADGRDRIALHDAPAPARQAPAALRALP
jgi:diguanylate cyclase